MSPSPDRREAGGGVSFRLDGRVVLITGATRGIGAGIVRQCLKAGASVALTSRDEAECRTVAEAMATEFGRPADEVIGIAADLQDADALTRMAGQVTERLGRIDALVLNAAHLGRTARPADVDLGYFGEVLAANMASNFHLARLVAPEMARRGGGSIVFVTSISATAPLPGNIPYSSSKAGIVSIARSLAAEFVSTGVRVNCVAPGLIRSDSSRVIWEREASARDYYDKNIPMRRIGEAEEIGAACVYLSASAGAYLTGTVLHVDGGRADLGYVMGGYGDQTSRVPDCGENQ